MATASPAANPTSSSPDSDGYTRLHITPLDSELLGIVIPAAVLPKARNVSYHTIETFPENRYGFVDLPTMDADKLKKKLNGATLKGVKLRVENAKPLAIRQPTTGEGEGQDPTSNDAKKEKRSKKRKLDGNEVPGVELRDRKVKRGWTVTEDDMIKEKRSKKEKAKNGKDVEDKAHKAKKGEDVEAKADKKREKKERGKAKSKYTDKPECLFKQKLPEASTSRNNGESDGHKKKKRKSDRQVVVHEFEKSMKVPTFLKSSNDMSKPKPVTYEEGKGWVDEEGNIVEPPRDKKRHAVASSKKLKSATPPPQKDDSETSSSGSSSEDDDKEESASSVSQAKSAKEEPPASDDDTSSSDSSDESSSEEENTKGPGRVAASKEESTALMSPQDETSSTSDESSSDDDRDGTNMEKNKVGKSTRVKKLSIDTTSLSSPLSAVRAMDPSRPRSSGSSSSLSIKIPPVTPAATKVHPLEALYKRQPGGTETPAAESKPFSFFNDDDMEKEDASTDQFPLTPFTKEDYDFRNVRSAAPTPDTAHPSRSHYPWAADSPVNEDIAEEVDEDGEDEDGDVPMTDAARASVGEGGSKPEATEFEESFWKNRGDLNRAWKKRRRTAAKEKRNRDNRARAARAI